MGAGLVMLCQEEEKIVKMIISLSDERAHDRYVLYRRRGCGNLNFIYSTMRVKC
jgi:hypothetical protein